MVALCRDLEAVQLGIPTGVQDFWPALLGGALRIRYGPGAPEVTRLAVDLDALRSRMVIAYTGQSRLSARTNWDLFRRFLDGDRRTRDAFEGIAEAAREMERALVSGDLDAAGLALGVEMNHRARLAPGIETTESASLTEGALREGALGAKVCGAGGGGCMVFWAREGYKEALSGYLAGRGARVLEAAPSARGLHLEVAG